MKYEQEFIDWLYENHPIGNGDMLLNLMEDGDMYLTFLQENGLVDNE